MSHLQLDDQQQLDTPDDELSMEQWERKRALERAQYETWDKDVVRIDLSVYFTGSKLPDLVAGAAVFCLVRYRAYRILKLSW